MSTTSAEKKSRPLPLKQRTSSRDTRKDYTAQTWLSLLGLLKFPREYLITVDHSSIWRRHLAWAIADGKELRDYMTQRYASSMVFMSLLLSAELGVLFNSAAVTSDVRRALMREEYTGIRFWAGMAVIVSAIVTLLGLISTFTAWTMVSAISDNNAHCVFRSSIGQYAAELPRKYIVGAIYSFLVWLILYFFILLPLGVWSVSLSVLAVALFVHTITAFSAFGRIIMHTGAMGSQRIFERSFESNLFPHSLHANLLNKARANLANNTSIMRQYRNAIQPIDRPISEHELSGRLSERSHEDSNMSSGEFFAGGIDNRSSNSNDDSGSGSGSNSNRTSPCFFSSGDTGTADRNDSISSSSNLGGNILGSMSALNLPSPNNTRSPTATSQPKLNRRRTESLVKFADGYDTSGEKLIVETPKACTVPNGQGAIGGHQRANNNQSKPYLAELYSDGSNPASPRKPLPPRPQSKIKQRPPVAPPHHHPPLPRGGGVGAASAASVGGGGGSSGAPTSTGGAAAALQRPLQHGTSSVSSSADASSTAQSSSVVPDVHGFRSSNSIEEWLNASTGSLPTVQPVPSPGEQGQFFQTPPTGASLGVVESSSSCHGPMVRRSRGDNYCPSPLSLSLVDDMNHPNATTVRVLSTGSRVSSLGGSSVDFHSFNNADGNNSLSLEEEKLEREFHRDYGDLFDPEDHDDIDNDAAGANASSSGHTTVLCGRHHHHSSPLLNTTSGSSPHTSTTPTSSTREDDDGRRSGVVVVQTTPALATPPPPPPSTPPVHEERSHLLGKDAFSERGGQQQQQQHRSMYDSLRARHGGGYHESSPPPQQRAGLGNYDHV